jgi:3D (Asp-Asp-Asp) domain-containing protein
MIIPKKPISSSEVKTTKYYLRITAYSPKEIGESKRGSRNNCIRNERGVALSRDLGIPYGTRVILPNGELRVVDDTTHRRIKKTCDVRYYQSVSKRGIKKQLRELDMGWDYIEVVNE